MMKKLPNIFHGEQFNPEEDRYCVKPRAPACGVQLRGSPSGTHPSVVSGSRPTPWSLFREHQGTRFKGMTSAVPVLLQLSMKVLDMDYVCALF